MSIMVKASTFVLALGMVPVSSFQNAAVTTTQRIRIGTTYTSTSQSICTQRRTSPLHMNFFKDLIGGAFENDPNLSRDKSEGQLEGPNDDDMNIFASNVEKTDVQKRWLESQSNAAAATAEKANTATATKSKFGGGFGAPMDPELLPNTKWKLALYLTGIPSFDPSNSLYGAKTNISTRRDSSLAKDGFAIGADVLPTESSVEFEIKLLENGICQIDESAFTTGQSGEWKLSDDGRSIRFSLDVSGYERTVTTKGTIQNVAWSDQGDVQRKSSATYEIQPGLVYCEAGIGFGSKPGVFVMAQEDGSGSGPAGILSVEKTTGVFGIRSTMLACGKFSAEMIV